MVADKLVGKEVNITDKESMFYGSWGIVAAYDGEYFHVRDANGETTPIFTRDQIKIKK